MLKTLCKWLSQKYSSIFAPFSGLSGDDIRSHLKHISSQKQSDELNSNDYTSYLCQFCHHSGRDRFKAGPCRVCNGTGTVKRHFEDPVDCKHCQGKGVEPYQTYECKVCGGAGVIERLEKLPQKPKIPITSIGPESSEERKDIQLPNQVSKSTNEDRS